MAGFAQKFKNMWNPPEEEEIYEEQETFAAEDTAASEPQDIYSDSTETYTDTSSDTSYAYDEAPVKDNVIPFKTNGDVQVVLFKPLSYKEDTRLIAEELTKANTVVLNLEVTPKEEARRILDFLGGVALAKDGKVVRVSTSTYIITPKEVSFVSTEADEDEAEEY